MNKIFEEVVQNIPNYTEFLTVDEMDANSRKLAEEYPDVVDIFEVGRTRENHPLYCLKIGEGSKNALMFGLPHPNEPIGAMLLEYFTQELATNEKLRNELDYTWYIIKAWDADGTKLNEGWFKGPFTLYNYARNFFRPAGHQQVDWTFPIDYKKLKFNDSIPETTAMMKLIDQIEPEFIYSLHNAGFGGAYWYITHETSDVYDDLRKTAIKHGVPLSLGEPEAPFCEAYSPAIYQSLGIRQNYDYLEKYGVEKPEEHINVGTCSADYAMEKYDSFTLLTELPYFYDERIKDLSESAISRKEAVLSNLEFAEESDKFILQVLKETNQYTSKDNPFRLALEAFTDNKEGNAATREMVLTDPVYAKKATVAEEFDNLLVSKFYKMLSYGMLVRLSESELEKLKENPEEDAEKEAVLEAAYQNALAHLKELSDKLEQEINYQAVPIQKLVAIQLECGLILADHLQKKKIAK
ncbi:zinc carboxypeptidase [Sporosarcina luteola]|uniref:Zinc carboxypeptidase n=1 Tax=Sporosarcina luteola TaxID=582850 RepID=A0A511Z371_9BACL|nr:M14 family zinc carboxypeptidase [Sporosarcina luteola]GEN81890.1 zinc carboxypeptidase [Sporosarcina luteola]